MPENLHLPFFYDWNVKEEKRNVSSDGQMYVVIQEQYMTNVYPKTSPQDNIHTPDILATNLSEIMNQLVRNNMNFGLKVVNQTALYNFLAK